MPRGPHVRPRDAAARDVMSYASFLRPSEVFCTPMQIDDPDGCFFTHTIDLPVRGTMPGQWDLRGGVDDCLGFVAVSGKRVLHLGGGSGFLSFEMEKRGAEVVCLDGSGSRSWDIVPFPRLDAGQMRRMLDQHLEAIRRAYWLSHAALGSRIRLARGTAYAVPDIVGPADIVVLSSVLPSLRDPFRGLHATARLARETLIITEGAAPRRRWLQAIARPLGLSASFVPRADRPTGWNVWWRLSPETVQQMLAILGFAESAVHTHRQRYLGASRPCYTIVARRTDPTNDDPETC